MRRATKWFAAALVALLTAWVFAPAAVPIYDGLSNPDEPYRYVDPPPTAKTTKKPTTARRAIEIQNGTNLTQFVNSTEVGPQISVYVPAGSLDVPTGVTSAELSATPQAPAPPLPSDGTIVTNVYVLAATAGDQELDVIGTGKDAPTIQMRAPTGKQPGPVFEHRVGDHWEQVKTARVGNDIYQASAEHFGDWALVQLDEPASADSGGSRGVNGGLLAAGIGVLLVAGVILAIRWRRTSGGAD